MIKQIDYFILQNSENFAPLLKTLAAAGIDEKFITNKRGDLYINLKGSLLTCELDEQENRSYMHFYTLKFKDTEICATNIKDQENNAGYSDPGYTRSFFKTVYGLPNWLLQEGAPKETIKKVKPDILFFVGTKAPNDLQMKHLAYVGITPSNLIKVENNYYFQLPGDKEFHSFTSKIDDYNDNKDLKSSLQFKGVEIATSYQRSWDNWLIVDNIAISNATHSIANILAYPLRLADHYPEEVYAEGTIEACAEGIKKNLYHHFTVANIRDDDIFKGSNYNSFNESNKAILFEALKSNNSLTSLRLVEITLNKNDLVNLIDILLKHPKQPKLELISCKLNMIKQELILLAPKLDKIKIYSNLTFSRDLGELDLILREYHDQPEQFISKNKVGLLSKLSAITRTHDKKQPQTDVQNDRDKRLIR